MPFVLPALVLLFLVSGAATSFMLSRAGATGSLLGARAVRLLVPLVFGMLVVVPQGHWHRFQVPGQVTVLTATPQPTEHTIAEDPRTPSG